MPHVHTSRGADGAQAESRRVWLPPTSLSQHAAQPPHLVTVSSVACDVTSQILMLLSNETEATFWLSGSKQQAVSDIRWGSEAQGKWLDTAPSALWATRPWDTEVAPPRQRQYNRNTTLVFTRKGLFTCIIISWMPAVYQAVNQERCPLPPRRSQADTAEQATTCSKRHSSKPAKGDLAQPWEVAKSYGGKQERKSALGRRNRVCRGLTWGHVMKEHGVQTGLRVWGERGHEVTHQGENARCVAGHTSWFHGDKNKR